jgi:RimJ/RimL family protein N-acetyltransferase
VTLPLVTARLVVRESTSEDVPELARAYADPEVIWWSPEPFSLEDARSWVASALRGYADDGLGLYAVEERSGGRLIGDTGLVARVLEGTPMVEIGWHLEREVWGRGYATEEARAVRAHAAAIGLTEMCALIVPENERSRRVAQKLGMTVDRQVVHAGLPHDLRALDLPA